MRSQTKFGRFAKPEEIADTVSFLVSEQSTYITGKYSLDLAETGHLTLGPHSRANFKRGRGDMVRLVEWLSLHSRIEYHHIRLAQPADP